MTQPQQSPVELPALLERLLAASEANIAKVQTICGRATLRIERDEFERAVDRDGNSFRMQTAAFALWKDGERLRIDRRFDRVFDLANNSILYHFPMPDVVGTVKCGDAKSFAEKHGSPRETIRYLQADGREYVYSVESKYALVRHAKPPYPIMAELQWLTDGPTVLDRTLRELLIGAVRRGMDVRLEDDGPGRQVLTISTHYILEDGSKMPTSTRVVIDIGNGSTIRHMEGETDGKVHHTADYEYVQVGGAWVVVDGEDRHVDPTSGRITRRTTLHVEAISLRINDGIDPNVFNVGDLELAKGTLMYDQFKGEKYLHNDVSILDKVRMNQAAQR